MRTEDVLIEADDDEPGDELTAYLDVRPMSSRRELRSAELLVHNAIKFDRSR